MPNILEVLTLSTDYLKQKNIQNPRRQAEELLGEALKTGRMGLYLEYDRPLTEDELERCRSWLKRRGQGEPLQYISGQVEFLGCKLKITRDVLIPRQETELLADKIDKELKTLGLEGKSLWDICCGSGCLGISLKKLNPILAVILADISPAAAEIAKENALLNEVNVDIFVGDLFLPFQGKKTDFIICNPPYVSEGEFASLDVEVQAYEPKHALIGGVTGLEFYERLSKELLDFLNPGAKVWMEIGDGQGERVQALFKGPYWKHCRVERDWSGRERFFSLEIE